MAEAKGSVVKSNTDASMKMRNTARMAIGGIGALAFAVMVTIWISGGEPEARAGTTATQSKSPEQLAYPTIHQPLEQWRMVTIGPSGFSERIPIPPRTRPIAKGSAFALYSVYEDGSSCDVTTSCPDRPAIQFYLENKSATDSNVVSIAFERV